jgi:hypothetical protein
MSSTDETSLLAAKNLAGTPPPERIRAMTPKPDTDQQAKLPTPPAGEDRAEAIARLAYSKWQGRGCPEGDDLRDWLEAEGEVAPTAGRQALATGASPRSSPSVTA